jgi:type IV pilus assembly protein PilB
MKEFDFEKIPIVEIANEIIMDAVNKDASDIHFDCSKDNIKIRLRVDGILFDYGIIPNQYKRNMISRIKMIAGMNIMETRLPQDGAIKNKVGDRFLDLRVSSLPTNNGEKIVIRILDYSKSLEGLDNLGFSKNSLDKINKMIKVPNGIILVTGATGTGKSTTVYSILQKLNTEDVNIISVEDPIEMDISGINQVQVQSEIGLSFSNVLRSILRQDPNIIMIGEIRDDETARIAVRASITGHLVLSTLHTNNSLNTIERLTDMEIERYLLGSALTGIISQRLARKLCSHCRRKRPTTQYEKNVFNLVLHTDINEMYEPNKQGCEFCSHGYKERIAILEVLLINDSIREAITNGVPKRELRNLVYNGDVITLLQDGLEKVVSGETSFEEILKIIDLENDITAYQEDNLKESLKIERMKSENSNGNIATNTSINNTQPTNNTTIQNPNVTPPSMTNTNSDIKPQINQNLNVKKEGPEIVEF